MSRVVLTAEERIAAPPAVVFALFGAGAGAGWVFDAACDRVVAGSVVTFRLPAAIGPANSPFEILGRIAAVRPPSRIVIVHDQPWRGQIKLSVDPEPDESVGHLRTRVRLAAEIDASGVEWLMRKRGYQLPDDLADNPADDGDWSAPPHRVGLLTSKSGPGSAFAVAAENLAMLAADE